jgi:hypothetical protein
MLNWPGPWIEDKIVPAVRLPELSQEAFAVYRRWHEKPDRIDF